MQRLFATSPRAARRLATRAPRTPSDSPAPRHRTSGDRGSGGGSKRGSSSGGGKAGGTSSGGVAGLSALREALAGPAGAHQAVTVPAAVNTYASLYRSPGGARGRTGEPQQLPVAGRVADEIENVVRSAKRLEPYETTVPKRLLADAHRASKQYAYVFNGLKTFSLDLPPRTEPPIG
eukprot:TRINITY_DN664_c0_g1_i1.p1 TRINITY_DN664_c0_g1~~TRINITY_DN664_c0_g1_i1.p1  ORF type:complete len:199 (+),score=79.86 TRINITY_DN664_c0_g1_i1:69-599(+)